MNRMMVAVLSTIQFYIPGQYIIVKHKSFKNADKAVLPQGLQRIFKFPPISTFFLTMDFYTLKSVMICLSFTIRKKSPPFTTTSSDDDNGLLHTGIRHTKPEF